MSQRPEFKAASPSDISDMVVVSLLGVLNLFLLLVGKDILTLGRIFQYICGKGPWYPPTPPICHDSYFYKVQCAND